MIKYTKYVEQNQYKAEAKGYKFGTELPSATYIILRHFKMYTEDGSFRAYIGAKKMDKFRRFLNEENYAKAL